MSQKLEKEKAMEAVKNCEKENQQNESVIVENSNSEQERLIFSESIKHLDGNKLTKLNEKNKSLEAMAPTESDTEWFNIDNNSLKILSNEFLPITIIKTEIKECCMPNCCNTEITEPEKTFYSLPTEKNELESLINEIGIRETEESNSLNGDNNCRQYYLCSDHIASCQGSIISRDNLDSGYQMCPLSNGLSNLSVDENDLPDTNGNFNKYFKYQLLHS